MSKHTPGPWKVDGQIVRSPSGVSVASVLNIAWPYGVKPESPEANALLVAAAPELLDALMVLRGACAAAGWLTIPEHIEHMDIARAAIAKATGSADA